MEVLAKGIIKYTIIQYIGVLLSFTNAVLLFPKILTSEELGLIRLLFSFSIVIAHIAEFGSNNMMIRFHQKMKRDDHDYTLFSGTVFSLTGFLLTSLVLLVLKDPIVNVYSSESGLFGKYYLWIFLLVFSIVSYDLLDAFLSITFKNSVTAFLKFIFQRVLHLAVIIGYSISLFDFSTFVQLYVLAQLVIAVAAFFYAVFLKKLPKLKQFKLRNIVSLPQVSAFGFFTVLSNLSHILIGKVDILMLGKMRELEAVAIYSVAFSISTILAVPAASITKTIAVLIPKALHKNDVNRLNMLYKKSALNQFFFGALVFVLIAINYDRLMEFLPNTYNESKNAFIFLGLASVVHLGFGANGILIINSKYYKWDTLFALLLLLLAILTNYLLIPILGVVGSAIATFISVVVFNILKFLFVLIKFNLSPFSRSYFLLIIIILASFTLQNLLPSFSSWLIDVLIRSAFVLTLAVSITYFLRILPEMNSFIKKVLP